MMSRIIGFCSVAVVIAVLIFRHHRAKTNWAMNVRAHHRRFTSQFGQDGAIAYVFANIGVKNSYYVEYGFDTNVYTGGGGSNTYHLNKHGWKGLLLDGNHSNPSINLVQAWISSQTIVSYFQKHDVPLSFDFLSSDLDSSDLWVLRAILAAGYRPRVILQEYNPNYPLESTLTNRESTPWQGPMFGASLNALAMVGDEFGYAIVDIVGHDLLFVLKSELQGTNFPSLFSWKGRTRLALYRHYKPTREELASKLVDYAVYRATGDMSKAGNQTVLNQIDCMNIFAKEDTQFFLV